MNRRFFTIAVTAALFFCAGALVAHHSTETNFDLSTTYLLRGVISGVSWANPHLYAFMDVTTCKTDPWAVELGSPNTMNRAGLRRDMLQKGTPISVYASPAKFASASGLPGIEEAWKSKHLVLGGCMTLADGTKIEYSDGPKCSRPKQDVVIGTPLK